MSDLAITGVAGRPATGNCIADPRDVTRSALMVASAVVSSSVMPSAKYACVVSRGSSSNGSTAMERIGLASASVVDRPRFDSA